MSTTKNGINLATVFSGIGAIEHALNRMSLPHNIVFACDNGDIDILSKKIDVNISIMQQEIDLLQTIISTLTTNKESSCDLIDLADKLDKSKQMHISLIEQLSFLENKIFTDNVEFILDKIIRFSTLKKSIQKKFQDASKSLSCVVEYDKVLIALKNFLMVLNSFAKDNYIEELSNIEFFSNITSTDNIAWDSCLDKLKETYFIFESIQGKKILKYANEVSERLSMLHESIMTIKINKHLLILTTYKQKKSYIDSLYAKYEKSNKVKISYKANYPIKDENYHWNISFLDGKQYENNVDLFVGGSPCQSFSLVGKQRGLEDTRGTLFYEYARLIKEIRPKIFIYENVKALLNNDNGRTWKTMQQVFTDLKYKWHAQVLNAKDYGIPQNRERIFVVGFRNDLVLEKPFSFPNVITLQKTMQDFLLDNVSGQYYLPKKGVDFVTSDKNLIKRYTQIDGEIQLCQKKNQQFNWHGDFVFVEDAKAKIELMQDLEKYFLSEKVRKYVLASGTKSFYSRPQTDLAIARPLLTTMHKMHRAGVDNYVTTDGRLRKLTPRECLRLMGFCDSFDIVVSDTSMYQQSGNAIVVDVLIAIVKKILESYPQLILNSEDTI